MRCGGCGRIFRDRSYLALTLAPPARRRGPAAPAGRHGAGRAYADGRDRRRALPRAGSGGSCRMSSPASARAARSTRRASGASAASIGCLKSPAEMARLFARHPEAVGRTLGDRRAVPVFARRSPLPVSRGGRRPCADAAADIGEAGPGERAAVAIRRGCRRTSSGNCSMSCG